MLREHEEELRYLQQTICTLFPFLFPRRGKDYWKQIVLTSNLLSRLAFLKAEVTELASFSAIHALKSFTAKEAAIPFWGKTQNMFQSSSTRIRDGSENYEVTKWLEEYTTQIHLWQWDQLGRAEMLFCFSAALIFWSVLDCLRIFSFCITHLHSIVQRFPLQLFFSYLPNLQTKFNAKGKIACHVG